ncbi:MAG: hypothetical protein JW915_19780 [Chitinispirillaceae bacterium]|nr:hypothetical protein [Chitinispirillaceae bacterium]
MIFSRNFFSFVCIACSFVLFPICTVYSQTSDTLNTENDSIKAAGIVSPDSLMTSDTSSVSTHPDTTISILNDSLESRLPTDTDSQKVDSTSKLLSADIEPEEDSIIDFNGTWLGISLGWTIGSFELVNQWQQALPDSLSHFSLNDTSFKMADSTVSTYHYSDTSRIKYLIKELPGVYNISVPVSLCLTKISETGKKTLLLSFAYIGKTQKAIITGLTDTLSETVNIKQNLRSVSLSLEGNYSFELPEKYFKVDGVDRSYFTAGISLSSIIVKINNDIDHGGKSIRMDSIRSAVNTVLDDKSAIGAALSFRAGFTTIRALSKKNFVEFGFSYIISRNDYFYSDGHRLKKEWINPGVKDFNKPLNFYTNKIEISVGISRRIPGKE